MRWLFVLLIILAVSVTAQPLTLTASSSLAESDTAKKLVIGHITLEGNRITKDKIVLRELEFKSGDSLSLAQLNRTLTKSQQNLMNRSLFNFVTISDSVRNELVDIKIKMIERWYIWPIPILQYADRNVNVWWQNKDLSRLNIGIDLKVENFRGRMERLNIIVQGGYDQTYAFKWSIPYLTKNQVVGMSTYAGIRLNHEVAYQTSNNTIDYYKDPKGYARQQLFSELALSVRPGYNFSHTLFVGFSHIDFADTLLLLNPDYSSGRTQYDYLELKYLYKHDLRDYKPYPLTGYYFDFYARKLGLGLIENSPDMWSLQGTFDHYLKLYRRWYFAYNVTAKFTNPGLQPYFLSSAIGYEGLTIRGYELYVVNGQQLGVFKSNLKFAIIPQRVYDIKWIKTDKFGKIFYALYANVFFDGGYASDRLFQANNPLNNQFLWGSGMGVDIVSYYDVVIRLEGSINKQGDRGFYVAFVAPI